MSNIKKYFAGANTSNGFYDLFNNIRIDNSKGFHYIIKGGAGTGKSTLMKTIANHFLSKGENLELFYCSSDPNSLDGINIKNHNITMVDGTAPHIVNDFSPSLEDKIINLGEYISPSIIKHKNKIDELLEIKKSHFSTCYSYLKIAGELYKLNKQQNPTDIKSTCNKIINDLSLIDKKVKTTPRELFINVLSSLNINFEEENNFNISNINSKYNINSDTLKLLSKELCNQGFNVIEFKNYLDPSEIESLYIEDINLLIKETQTLKKPAKQINSFISKATNELNKASLTHKKIESYYIKKVNYVEINKLTQSLINEIELRIKNKV